MTDRERIIDRLVRLFVSIDERDWRAVEGCFADTVFFDMTSLAGGTPQKLQPPSITTALKESLGAIDASHHQAGNFLVDRTRDEADVTCYALAIHYRERSEGRNTRTLAGTYDFHLMREGDDWLIDLFRFTLRFTDGGQ